MRNQFCRNTKIPSDAYRLLVKYWVDGKTAKETSLQIGRLRCKISREAVNSHFIRIGNHAYDLFRTTWLKGYYELANIEKDKGMSFDEFDELAQDAVYFVLTDEIKIYELNKAGNFAKDQFLLAGIDFLRERSRVFNGLHRKTFRSHLGWAWWRVTASHFRISNSADEFLDLLIKRPL